MLAAILGMDIPAKDRIWEAVKVLPNIENRKFAIWCARQANRDNIPAVTKFLDAVEEFYIFGTLTKKEMDASRAEYCAAYGAAADDPEEWAANCPAYRSSDWAVYNVAYWAAYNAAYWAAVYRAADWEAQIEHLKTA